MSAQSDRPDAETLTPAWIEPLDRSVLFAHAVADEDGADVDQDQLLTEALGRVRRRQGGR